MSRVKTSHSIMESNVIFLYNKPSSDQFLFQFILFCLIFSGGSRIFERWFPLVVDHRRRGLGVQPPAAEEDLIFKSIQSIESYNILYLRPLSFMI